MLPMKKLALSFLLITSARIAFPQCASQSNIYAFTFGGRTYEVVKELKTWSQAAACAVQRGGYLVQIDSASEQSAVYTGILNAGVTSNYHPVSDGGGASYVWIGATDKLNEGAWLWDGDDNGSGTNFWNGQGQAGTGGGSAIGGSYVNWGGASLGPYNEPDNYNNIQDCGGVGVSPWPYGIASEWNDINCANTLYYVIEYNNSSSTGPIVSDRQQPEIYPNPFGEYMNVTVAAAGEAALINVLGKEILLKKITAGTNRIETAGLAPGIYFVRIKTAAGVITLRITHQ